MTTCSKHKSAKNVPKADAQDDRLAALGKSGHHPVQAKASLGLTELSLNSISDSFIFLNLFSSCWVSFRILWRSAYRHSAQPDVVGLTPESVGLGSIDLVSMS
jgi:hypothetical protein